jgi:sodium/potassium/calcium exchanger 6
VLSVVVHFTTHESRPPAGAVSLALTCTGFVMCSAWIYTIAGELVAVIEALGTLWGLPSSLLGLTLLAWGNSVGDLITNIAVARAGLSDMAVAGCFAGPTFNLLVGLGLSFLWKCLHGGSFELRLDQRSYVSLAFLYLGLSVNLFVAYFTGFRLNRPLAYALIGLYILCTLLQISLLVYSSTAG